MDMVSETGDLGWEVTHQLHKNMDKDFPDIDTCDICGGTNLVLTKHKKEWLCDLCIIDKETEEKGKDLNKQREDWLDWFRNLIS